MARGIPLAEGTPMSPALPPALRRTLRRTFGLTELRAGQAEVIDRVLAGRDTLAIMPTGAGKSLCYQLPALHLDGTTVVVSPLISLMKDQAEKLEDAGVAAEQLNSAQSASAQDASLTRIEQSASDVVFATPERLVDPEFQALLAKGRVALLVVDEAHCISQWGHDFRPAYLGLGAALQALGRPPVLALTATATPDVVEDIRAQLGRPRLRVVHTGMYRDNLRLRAVQAVNDDEKFSQLQAALARTPGSGIVYVSTVKVAEALHERLLGAGESVALYHGRLPAAQRHANQESFMGGAVRVMVATNAFGMGIDKADIRFVVHYQLPGSPQAYYQEAGRAGRDGEAADCTLIFHRRDRQVQQFFLARKPLGVPDLRAVLGAVPSQAPAEGLHLPRTRVAAALAQLRAAGLVRHDATQGWRATTDAPVSDAALSALVEDAERKAERDHEALERMVFYAQTGFCRWRVLLQAFGEAVPFAQGCGHCDNCLRPPPAATPGPLLGKDRPAERARALRRQAPPFTVGDVVTVPRLGDGEVLSLAGDEVTLRMRDGSERTFVASYVRRARTA